MLTDRAKTDILNGSMRNGRIPFNKIIVKVEETGTVVELLYNNDVLVTNTYARMAHGDSLSITGVEGFSRFALEST